MKLKQRNIDFIFDNENKNINKSLTHPICHYHFFAIHNYKINSIKAKREVIYMIFEEYLQQHDWAFCCCGYCQLFALPQLRLTSNYDLVFLFDQRRNNYNAASNIFSLNLYTHLMMAHVRQSFVVENIYLCNQIIKSHKW